MNPLLFDIDESTEPDWPVGPLLSDRMSVLCLKAEYVGNANPNFMQGIDSLKTRAMRRFDADVAIDAFWETFVDYLAAMETRSHAELVQDFQTEGGESEYL
ncbi:hypothetical protein L916_05407, partial [Phytophthora nicotianae]